MAQVVRLFAAKLLRYSVSIKHWASLRDVYLITADADILPLNVQPFIRNSPEWYLFSAGRVSEKGHSLYVALSYGVNATKSITFD